MYPHWLSLWPVFSATGLWKHTHQVLLLRLKKHSKSIR